MIALLIFLLAAPQVTAIGAGTGVESRTLVGVASRFPANGAPVFVHATLTNAEAEQAITWVWLKDGQERWRKAQSVGTSEGWRTWTRMVMPPENAGTWTVEVRAADDTVLHAVVFIVARP